MAIEEGDSDAMCSDYYRDIVKDYDNMKHYYHMAIKKRNSNAMNKLGLYYQNTVKDYDNMKKYYLMAIDKGNSGVMNNLGWYYQFTRNMTI